MSTPREVLDAALAKWRALPAEHREWLLGPLFAHVRLVQVEGRNWDEPWKHDVVAALAELGSAAGVPR